MTTCDAILDLHQGEYDVPCTLSAGHGGPHRNEYDWDADVTYEWRAAPSCPLDGCDGSTCARAALGNTVATCVNQAGKR